MVYSYVVINLYSIWFLHWQSHYDNCIDVAATSDDASMDEMYVTNVDDKQVDNHDYDDSTDDARDSNNDTSRYRACNARVSTSTV